MRTITVEGITKRFNGVTALEDVTFTADDEQIKAIIGPNGAGKTTLFNIISGLLKPDGGSVYLGELDITRLPPRKRALLGIGRTFQKSLVFENLTVLENVLVIAENVLRREDIKNQRPADFSRHLLKVVGIDEKRDLPASLLTSGERHLLEIARALALKPRVLLLDEPAAGLNDAETEMLGEVLRRIRGEGLSLLLVEHDMKFVMTISDEVVALNQGRKIAEGPPMLIQEDRQVIEAYLGSDIHSV